MFPPQSWAHTCQQVADGLYELYVSGGASRNHGRRWESRSSDASARERGVSLIRSVYTLKLLSVSVLVCALSYFYVYRLCKLTRLNALKVVNRPVVHRTVHQNKFWHNVFTLMIFQTWMTFFMRNKNKLLGRMTTSVSI